MTDIPIKTPAPADPARAEVDKVRVPQTAGWLYCFGGLVDARQACAVVVGSVDEGDDIQRYVVRVKLPGGDSMTVKVGPYEEASLAHAVAEQIVQQVIAPRVPA